MASSPASPVGLSLFCPVDRYQTNDLADHIAELTELSSSGVAEILRGSVNIRGEKMSPEHRKQYTADDSISAFEAYSYIKKLYLMGKLDDASSQSVIARTMHGLFFNGALFQGLQPPRAVQIKNYHDADTATILETQAETCNAGPSSLSIRISGIDAPEVGRYSERDADLTRGKNSPYITGKLNFDTAAAPTDKDKGRQPWINSKLVGNVDEVHFALAKEGHWNPAKLSFQEREAINNIIAAAIDYTGQIATLPMNDLLAWSVTPAEAGAKMMIDSQIRWTSDDTPAPLCGSWQPYDIYGRGLEGFLEKDTARLEGYIRTRLADLMQEKGGALHDAFQQKVAPWVQRLEKTKAPGLKEAAAQIVGSMVKPAEIYNKDRCKVMADEYAAFVKKWGVEAALDDQVFQIAIGSVYDYMKYRNQSGEMYMAAGDLARARRFGLWTETTFRTLWDVNATKPRYHPSDCQK